MIFPTQTAFQSAMQALPLVSVDWVVVDAAESVALKTALPGKLQAVNWPQAAYLAQHGAWRWLSPAEDAAHEQPLHAYVQPYLGWVEDVQSTSVTTGVANVKEF